MDPKPSYADLMKQIPKDPVKKQFWLDLNRTFYEDPISADLWTRLLTHMQMKTPKHPRQDLWKALNHALTDFEHQILTDLPGC